jgi:hypothetical protein
MSVLNCFPERFDFVRLLRGDCAVNPSPLALEVRVPRKPEAAAECPEIGHHLARFSVTPGIG